jgi:hypothetical protein
VEQGVALGGPGVQHLENKYNSLSIIY